MAAPVVPARLSDLEFLSAYDEYARLRGPLDPKEHPKCAAVSKAVKRRIIEAMMVNWAFGGPIKSSMTPAVSAGLGLLVSRSPYGGLVGTALGAGVSCLGPMYTKWHLSAYAESDPDCTLESMAECWKALNAGQGDGWDVRKQRVEPSLGSVPNGLRRWMGIAFIYVQSSTSLRRLFSDVYTDSLTASPALQGKVHEGKDMLLHEREREVRLKEDELSSLRAKVDEQAAVIKGLQENGAYGDEAAKGTDGRLGAVEETVARILHGLGPLLSHLAADESADVTVVQLHVQSRRVIGVVPVKPNPGSHEGSTAT